ncbi:MAG: hypothetical protein HKP30_05350, partial [Myxococcales bacterium]|nr:hypothetical protein [Myxococcales bacterium]
MTSARTLPLLSFAAAAWLLAGAALAEPLGFVAARVGDVQLQPGGDGAFE